MAILGQSGAVYLLAAWRRHVDAQPYLATASTIGHPPWAYPSINFAMWLWSWVGLLSR